MKYQCIFWDNDGVLVNTERYYFQASREALLRVDIDLSEAEFARLSLTEGRSIFDLAKAQGVSTRTLEDLRRWRNARYAALLENEDVILDGTREVLAELHGRISMAVVTSSLKSHFEIIHRRTGLLPFFDFCLTREDYVRSKPAAEPYLLALQQSRQQAADVLVVEDSPRGLAAAKAAGLTCWVIPGQHTPQGSFQDADRILRSLDEIPALIR